MQVDRDFLIQQKSALEEQRNKALAVLNQASGALALIDILLQRIAEPDAETPSDSL